MVPCLGQAVAMRGVLFDKDGTLLDFEASWSRVYKELCLELAEGDDAKAEAMLVAGGYDLSANRFLAGGALAAGHTLDIVHVWYPALAGPALAAMVERIDKVFYKNGVACSVPVPGLAETLEALQAAGIAMGVATNDGTAATKAALEALDLDPLPAARLRLRFRCATEAGSRHRARFRRGRGPAGGDDRGDRRQPARSGDGAQRRSGRGDRCSLRK